MNRINKDIDISKLDDKGWLEVTKEQFEGYLDDFWTVFYNNYIVNLTDELYVKVDSNE